MSQLTLAGVRLAGALATAAAAAAFRTFLVQDGLGERINAALNALDGENDEVLAQCGQRIRERVLAGALPQNTIDDIISLYYNLTIHNSSETSFMVRSIAIAEGLQNTSSSCWQPRRSSAKKTGSGSS